MKTLCCTVSVHGSSWDIAGSKVLQMPSAGHADALGTDDEMIEHSNANQLQGQAQITSENPICRIWLGYAARMVVGEESETKAGRQSSWPCWTLFTNHQCNASSLRQ